MEVWWRILVTPRQGGRSNALSSPPLARIPPPCGCMRGWHRYGEEKGWGVQGFHTGMLHQLTGSTTETNGCGGSEDGKACFIYVLKKYEHAGKLGLISIYSVRTWATCLKVKHVTRFDVVYLFSSRSMEVCLPQSTHMNTRLIGDSKLVLGVSKWCVCLLLRTDDL